MKASIFMKFITGLCTFMLLFLILCLDVHAVQARTVDGLTINKKKASLTNFINFIEKKSDFTFWYRADIPTKANPITISVKNATIEQVMDLCVKDQPFTFKIIDKVITLVPDSNFSKTPFTSVRRNQDLSENLLNVNDGYQRQNSRLLTSSITTVNQKDLDQSTTGNLFDNMNINGLQINKNSRGNSSLLIRGKSSIMGGTEPLVLLDGVPYTGDINQLNRADIESINVLKDAGATAIYGSRGGNGVIVITSKKGGSIDLQPKINQNTIIHRNGYIYYNNSSIYNIADDIMSRFQVEIVFKGVAAAKHAYKGQVLDTISLEKMLDILKSSGIVLDTEGPLGKNNKREILLY